MLDKNNSSKPNTKNLNISLPRLDEEQLIQVAGGPIEIMELVIKVNVPKQKT